MVTTRMDAEVQRKETASAVLPADVLKLICQEMGPYDMAKLGMVCKHWNKVVYQRSLWERFIRQELWRFTAMDKPQRLYGMCKGLEKTHEYMKAVPMGGEPTAMRVAVLSFLLSFLMSASESEACVQQPRTVFSTIMSIASYGCEAQTYPRYALSTFLSFFAVLYLIVNMHSSKLLPRNAAQWTLKCLLVSCVVGYIATKLAHYTFYITERIQYVRWEDVNIKEMEGTTYFVCFFALRWLSCAKGGVKLPTYLLYATMLASCVVSGTILYGWKGAYIAYGLICGISCGANSIARPGLPVDTRQPPFYAVVHVMTLYAASQLIVALACGLNFGKHWMQTSGSGYYGTVEAVYSVSPKIVCCVIVAAALSISFFINRKTIDSTDVRHCMLCAPAVAILWFFSTNPSTAVWIGSYFLCIWQCRYRHDSVEA